MDLSPSSQSKECYPTPPVTTCAAHTQSQVQRFRQSQRQPWSSPSSPPRHRDAGVQDKASYYLIAAVSKERNRPSRHGFLGPASESNWRASWCLSRLHSQSQPTQRRLSAPRSVYVPGHRSRDGTLMQRLHLQQQRIWRRVARAPPWQGQTISVSTLRLSNRQTPAQDPTGQQDHRREHDLKYVSKQSVRLFRTWVQQSLSTPAPQHCLEHWPAWGARPGIVHPWGLYPLRGACRLHDTQKWRSHHTRGARAERAGRYARGGCWEA